MEKDDKSWPFENGRHEVMIEDKKREIVKQIKYSLEDRPEGWVISTPVHPQGDTFRKSESSTAVVISSDDKISTEDEEEEDNNRTVKIEVKATFTIVLPVNDAFTEPPKKKITNKMVATSLADLAHADGLMITLDDWCFEEDGWQIRVEDAD